LNWDNIRCMQL